jgi:hypothetical protein
VTHIQGELCLRGHESCEATFGTSPAKCKKKKAKAAATFAGYLAVWRSAHRFIENLADRYPNSFAKTLDMLSKVVFGDLVEKDGLEEGSEQQLIGARAVCAWDPDALDE